MIISFNKFINEEFTSGLFKTKIKGDDLILKINVSYNPFTKVNLIKDNEIYDNLSIELPNSNELRKGEFYLNPDINKNIVRELENQNFITKTNHTEIAGNEKTTSYILNI